MGEEMNEKNSEESEKRTNQAIKEIAMARTCIRNGRRRNMKQNTEKGAMKRERLK